MSVPLLEVRGLSVGYPGAPRPVLADVSLELQEGQTLGLVGESGSGKSTLAAVLTGQLRPTTGTIAHRGRDITHAKPRERRQIQIVFQDPYASLNPSLTIGRTLAEPLHGPRHEVRARVAEMLGRVGMPADAASRHPDRLSGGQRQRIAIARALIQDPEVVVCDEPTSALDLSVQAQILNLLLDLQDQLGVAYLLISHDTDVIAHMSHSVATLREGRIHGGQTSA